jgi:hypothetical protein
MNEPHVKRAARSLFSNQHAGQSVFVPWQMPLGQLAQSPLQHDAQSSPQQVLQSTPIAPGLTP